MKVFSFLLILLISSCGKNDSAKRMETSLPQRDTIKVEPNIDGQYLAKLFPINSHISGNITGSMTISIDKDEFVGDVRFFGNVFSTAKIVLEQTIHEGTRCPNLADDTNGDGIIDEAEMMAATGQTLIPLDGDLNSQWLGANTYPVSDEFGSYYYNQVASFEKLLNDLWDEDINSNDQLMKIPNQKKPDFEGKIAIIRGISPNVQLPDSVSKLSSKTKHATLPIMCGIFRKVKKVPGERNRDRYPMPDYLGENPEDNTNPTPPSDNTDPIEPVINYGE